MSIVLDYSWWRPRLADLKANGVVGVSRYLATGTGGKIIDKAEYDALLAAGLSVVLNWEGSGKDWRQGYSAGLADGKAARAEARALGHPDERPILFSVDENITPDQYPLWGEYQRGCNDGSGTSPAPQGSYGTTGQLQYGFDHGLIRVGWRNESHGETNNAYDDPRIAIEQHWQYPVGNLPISEYDANTTNLPDWGQHPKPAAPKPPAQPTHLLPGGFWNPLGGGYNVGPDGGVFGVPDPVTHKMPKFYNSLPGMHVKPNKPCIGGACTPTGKGYWLVCSDGGVFAGMGDSKFYGSAGGIKLNKPVVDMTPTLTGKGYWLLASDGGVFSYGDAVPKFKGAAPAGHVWAAITTDPKTGLYICWATDHTVWRAR